MPGFDMAPNLLQQLQQLQYPQQQRQEQSAGPSGASGASGAAPLTSSMRTSSDPSASSSTVATPSVAAPSQATLDSIASESLVDDLSSLISGPFTTNRKQHALIQSWAYSSRVACILSEISILIAMSVHLSYFFFLIVLIHHPYAIF